MKITIVTGPFLPCCGGPAGAVEKIWLGIAQEVVKQGHTATIVSRAWEGQPRREVVRDVLILRRSGSVALGEMGSA